MDNYSLAHTKWNYRYRVLFIAKYRRKVMYGKIIAEIRGNFEKAMRLQACGNFRRNGLQWSHTFMLEDIAPNSRIGFHRFLKVKSALMIFDRFPEHKQKGNRHFGAIGYYIDTVGRNEEQIRKYIVDQE